MESKTARSVDEADALAPPTLSVVVPVFNQAGSIIENVGTIRARIADRLDEPFETIVVSDGSIDKTEERLMEMELEGVRVFHYDRNLGKGYAVRVGALEARGDWVAFCDSDLDLDPAGVVDALEVARDHGLDFAIGSKRHPESQVQYPPSRVAASWLFQQFVHLLFRFDVRDTQVGLKVFRREIAEQVVPLLLVKRYAFDIELLAVAHAFGFTKIEERPVTLDYQFTGSGVRTRAVLRALVDTLAIFYRLRIIRYYQRRRRLGGAYAWTRPRLRYPSVTILTDDAGSLGLTDYPDLEVVRADVGSAEAIRAAAEASAADVLAVLESGGRPAANWLSATAPFFARSEIAAIVTPKVAPHTGSVLQQAAAAVAESRAGGGSHYFRFTPGNVRFVDEFETSSLLVRREALLALAAPVPTRLLAATLAKQGERVLYTPSTVVVAPPLPLFGPHWRAVTAYARTRGRSVRRRGPRALRLSTPVVSAFVVALCALAMLLLGASVVLVAAVIAAAYATMLVFNGLVAAIRYGSLAVGAVTSVGIAFTHLAYLVGLARGLVSLDEDPLSELA